MFGIWNTEQTKQQEKIQKLIWSQGLKLGYWQMEKMSFKKKL